MTLQHDKGHLSRQHLSWTEWYMHFPLNYCMVVVLKKLHLYKLIHVLSYRATEAPLVNQELKCDTILVPGG